MGSIKVSTINLARIALDTLSVKNNNKFFYPDAGIYDLPLYGNQFIPLGIKTTLQERIRIAAEFDKYCNGGSILHCSVDAPFDTYEKARAMVEYIADQGVTYFAFNTKIVGFYTAINTWSEKRAEEYHMRKYIDGTNSNVLNE